MKNPEIDKTLWGWFTDTTTGVDERNDRRAYREKYEKAKFWLGGTARPKLFDIISFRYERRHPILTDAPAISEDDHWRVLGRFFPESEHYRYYVYESSYGYVDVHFNECDCCGVEITFMNKSFSTMSICDPCDKEYDDVQRYGGLRPGRSYTVYKMQQELQQREEQEINEDGEQVAIDELLMMI